jgi:hypothetical protein
VLTVGSDADGLTHGNARNARAGLALAPGLHIVVGNEEADSALAGVVEVDSDGTVLVRVMPRLVGDNRRA